MQIRESSLERSEGLRDIIKRSFSGNRTSLEDVRESAMEMDKISARKRQSLEPKGSFQEPRSEQGRSGQKGREEELAAAEAEIASEHDTRHSNGPKVRPSLKKAKFAVLPWHKYIY